MPLNDRDEFSGPLMYPASYLPQGTIAGEGISQGVDIGNTEIGMDGLFQQSEIGADGLLNQSEIGDDGLLYPSEIGGEVVTPWDAFMSEPMIVGSGFGPQMADGTEGMSQGIDIGNYEIGMDGLPYNIEIGSSVLTPWDAFMSEPMIVGDDGLLHASEIGASLITPWDAFMSEPMIIGDDGISQGVDVGLDGISQGMDIGNVEIGAAVKKVIKKARDNRQPAPRMKAVDVDAPLRDEEEEGWDLADICIGAAVATGNPNPFPIMATLLQRFGAGGEPRFVRVDTEASYKQFRAENSPEMNELHGRMADLNDRLARHEDDPFAHSSVEEDVDNLTALGEEVKQAEAQKRVDIWLPQRFDGMVTAWREGDFVCASITLPGIDGQVRICTALEPIRRCVAEMAKHASEAAVPAKAVVGVLPAMGCVLGAGTVIKELAAAAPSILRRPEAQYRAPFVVRIEPKGSPALCALAALANECRNGNAAACNEWTKLADLGPPPVKQAMGEALALVKKAA